MTPALSMLKSWFWLLAVGFACRAAWGDAPWAVRDATLRVAVELQEPPTRSDAGYILELPDGGILPRPKPGAVVLDGGGATLHHACLWHDPDQGFALVFAPPERGKSVTVYFRSAALHRTWSANLGLNPSLILYVKPGPASEEDARAIVKRLPPGPGTHFRRIEEPTLGGNPVGRPGPFSACVVGSLTSATPGETWVAPLGPIAVMLDGHRVAPREKFQQSGGVGAYVGIPAEPVRLEMFYFGAGRSSDAMCLAWRPPGTKPEELGAGADGEPDWAARPVRAGECVKSGRAQATEIRARAGEPVAWFDWQPEMYVSLCDEPVILARLTARTAGHPPGTRYSWRFDGATHGPEGAEATWLIEGNRDHRVGLQTSSGKLASSCVRSVFGYCPGQKKSSMNSAEHRQAFRRALLGMLAAWPAGQDPVAAWRPSLWDLFLRVAHCLDGFDLLEAVFEGRWRQVRTHIDAESRWALEDLYVALQCGRDPNKAWAAIRELRAVEDLPARRARWDLKQGEMLMYYREDPEGAAACMRALAAQATDAGRRARIRLGDLALMKGDVNEATRLYGEVQDRLNPAAGPADPAGPPRTRPPPHERGARAPAPAKVEDWRVGAIRGTAVSETVRSLLRQGCVIEARAALDRWELEFPLSKLSGDFTVVEAMCLMAMGDALRAHRALAAYCAAVDMTGFLPEAMRLNVRAMKAAGQPQEKIRPFVQSMRKRFPNMPLDRELEALLPQPGTERR